MTQASLFDAFERPPSIVVEPEPEPEGCVHESKERCTVCEKRLCSVYSCSHAQSQIGPFEAMKSDCPGLPPRLQPVLFVFVCWECRRHLESEGHLIEGRPTRHYLGMLRKERAA